MSYEPIPGTIPFRAMEYMRSLPQGAEIASAELAEVLGQPSGQLTPALIAVVEHGLLKNRKKPGERFLLWSLGAGQPLKLRDEEDDELVQQIVDAQTKPSKPVAKPEVAPDRKPRKKPGRKPRAPNTPQGGDSQHVLKAEAARPDATDREPPAISSPVGGPMGAGQPAAADPAPVLKAFTFEQATVEAPKPFRCGVFSDGELLISKGSQNISLARPEFETLLTFLNRMCSEEGA